MAINAVLQPNWRQRFRTIIKSHILKGYGGTESKAEDVADDAVEEIETEEEEDFDADSDLDSDGG